MIADLEHRLSNRKAFWFILIASVLAHGVMPFMELVVSDDWFTLLADRTASIKAAWEGAVFLSMPLTVIQALPFFLIGDNLFVLRLINFGVIVANGWVFFLLVCELSSFERRQALAAAIISVVFPAYLVHFMVSFLFYPLGLLLFMAALLLTVKGEAQPIGKRLRYFIPALAMVFYSFHLGALLVFYAFFVLAHFSSRWGRNGTSFFVEVASYLNQRFVYLLLPFWFWGLRQAFALFFPTWESYNQPVLNSSVISAGISSFSKSYSRLTVDLVWSPWFLLTLLAISCFSYFARAFSADDGREVKEPVWNSLVWVFIGFGVLVAGLLPFVLVGKYPQTLPIEWRDKNAFDLASRQILWVIDSRMDLFSGMAAGLLVVGGLRFLRSTVKLPVTICSGLVAALVVSCCAYQVNSYVKLENKGIVMAGLREALLGDQRLKDTRIFGVVDRVGNISTTWDSWVLFFREVWGDTEHFGVPERWYGSELNRAIYYSRESIINKQLYGGAWYRFFKKPEYGAGQATIVLSYGPAASRLTPLGAWITYRYLKLTSKERLRTFLADYVNVEIILKKNAEIEFSSIRYADDWRQLKPRNKQDPHFLHDFDTPVEAPEHRASNVSVLDVVAAKDNLAMEFQVPSVDTTPARWTGRGRFVVVELEFDQIVGSDVSDSVIPFGEQFGDLAGVYKVAGKSVTIFASVRESEKAVGFRFAGSKVLNLIRCRVFEAPQSYDPGLLLVGKPYIFPEQIDADRFGSVFSATDYQIPQVFWRSDLANGNWPFERTEVGLFFRPKSPSSVLRSDLLACDSAKTSLLLVEWSVPQGTPRSGLLRIEDQSGKRILDIVPELEGGERFYLVPTTLSTGALSIKISSPQGREILLPKRISFIQTGDVKNLKTPLAAQLPR